MYKLIINTQEYKSMVCTKRNWEKGTINNFMAALDGFETKEPTEQRLRWWLAMFTGTCSKNEFSKEWYAWNTESNTKIEYKDVMCGLKRTVAVSPYGFKQGYVPIDKKIEELKQNKVVRIYFSEVYDIRQPILQNVKNCYLEISEVA